MTPRGALLVNPRACSPRSVRLPLSLLALGAALEGRHDYRIVDGNLDPDAAGTVLAALAGGTYGLVGLTVMPGPQVAPAIAISRAVRAAHLEVPIVWGGYFPTLYPEAAINAPYVDYLVRGQGEDALRELLERLGDAGPPRDGDSAADPGAVAGIGALTFKREGRVVHNPDRAVRPPDAYPPLPYARAGDPGPYLRPSFMGSRTGVYQAAVGCRYRCEFCGVVSMWGGATRLQAADRLHDEVTAQRDRLGATAMQFYDHNFFDREETSLPILEVLARIAMPWWCYARADTMAGFSTRTWELIRRSRLAMAYIGAESASDEVLRTMRKGSRVEHTLEVARRCREVGVIPEFSFVLGGPDDPAGEIDRTFRFIRRLKALHPECEVILYYYTPTPRRQPVAGRPGLRLPAASRYGSRQLDLPSTPEEWTEPRWIDFVCHQNAPWLTPELRRKVDDFACVLGCRFPTVQDYHTPAWGKVLLRSLASWRWAGEMYRNPRELRWLAERLELREPARESV